MLNVPNSRLDPRGEEQIDDAVFEPLDFEYILSALRRQFSVIVIAAFLGLLLGAVYTITTVRLYTSSVDIFIDRSQSQVVDELAPGGDLFQKDADVLSQIELLKSEHLARLVIENLELTNNERFMIANPSSVRQAKDAIKSVLSWAGSLVMGSGDDVSTIDTAQQSEREYIRAVNILRSNLTVFRKNETYVIRVQYESPYPELAARITKAYGARYLDDQLQAKYDATRRASEWLEDRIEELRRQAFQADLEVQKFRNENGLISSGDRLVSEQQLSEINSQLIIAQATTAEAEARVAQIQALIQSGRTDAVVGDALQSATINDLRKSFLDVSKRENEISTRLGEDHIQAVQLRAEMQEYQRQIFDELRRIGESYQSSLEVALSREASLRDSLNAITNVNETANTTQVQLRELEREASAFRNLYQTFLGRYQETVQQQSFPITEARIITPARVENVPSHPQTTLILALSIVLGGVAGTGFGVLREFKDRYFRTGEQVREQLGVNFLGYAGRLTPPRRKRNGKDGEASTSVWRDDSLFNYIADHSLSSFAETLRSAKLAADFGTTSANSSGAKVIGVVSCLPSEGKTTITANLAGLLELQGSRVLLIDGDLRNPGLTRALANRPTGGLVEALNTTDGYANQLIYSESKKLAVLPASLDTRVVNTSDLLSSPRMAHLLAELGQQFDYIIVDLPPAGPVVDSKAFSSNLDYYLFVVEWGRTSRRIVRNLMRNTPIFREKCLGVVLNKADESKMGLYQKFGSEEYYMSQYREYYIS